MGSEPILPVDFVGDEITDIRRFSENDLRFLDQF